MGDTPAHCRYCKAEYWPVSHGGLCGGCTFKQRRWRLSDPKQPAELRRRLKWFADKSKEHHPSNVCVICRRPIDDHRLPDSTRPALICPTNVPTQELPEGWL